MLRHKNRKCEKWQRVEGRRKRCPVVLVIIILIVLILSFSGVLKIAADWFSGRCWSYLELQGNENHLSRADVKKVVESANRSGAYVVATDADFERIKTEIDGGNESTIKSYNKIKKTADKLIKENDTSVANAESMGIGIRPVQSVAFMWRITGDEKYAKYAREVILNACKLETWNPTHFLDTSTSACFIALLTNWLYDYLSNDDKSYIASRVNELAFKEGRSLDSRKTWWKLDKHNWGTVCYSNMAIASIVFYDYYKDNAIHFIKNAYNKIPYAFDTFDGGVYIEGANYINLAMNYLVCFLSTSNNVFNTDFGISDSDKLKKVLDFPIYINGSIASFNFGDTFSSISITNSMYWFVKKYNDKALAYFFENTKMKSSWSSEIYKLLWYDEHWTDGYTFDEDNCVLLSSKNYMDIATIRSEYFNENATFFATKGGYNYTNHGDLDIGTFVYDYDGVRWVEDMGHGDYGLNEKSSNGIFDNSLGGKRWSFYAKRAEGHNTLVINGENKNEDQYLFAKVHISLIKENIGGGTVKIDMTDAYFGMGVKSAIRTFELSNNYSKLTVIDNISCTKNSDITWAIHTKAKIEIADSNTAIMTIDDKKMMVKLSSDSIGEFVVNNNVARLYESDGSVWDYSDSINKLMVKSSGNKGGKIEVIFTPIEN